jgi:shikimate kinase
VNITLIGMPGSGKSYIGKKLAKSLEYELIELDLLTETTFNLPLQQILEKLGEEIDDAFEAIEA